MTLLEKARKAKASGPQYPISNESIERAEVFAAWVMGEIDARQAALVLGLKQHNVVGAKVGYALREIGNHGLIEIRINRKRAKPEGGAA